MKKSELKALIKEVINETPLPSRTSMPPDVVELLNALEVKMRDRARRVGTDDPQIKSATLDALANLLIKGGWRKSV